METEWQKEQRLAREREKDERIERLERLERENDQLQRDVECIPEELEQWRQRVQELEAELHRLRELEARLPHDRNGNPVVPGDTVACPNGHEQRVGTPQQYMTCKHDGCYVREPGNKHQARYPLDRCYKFAPEAAQRAQEVSE